MLEEEEVGGTVDQWYSDLDLENSNFAHESYILDGSSAWWNSLAKIIAFLNLFMTLYSVVMVISQAKNSLKTYFKSIWAYFDIAYCVINGYISIELLREHTIDIEDLRKVESILSLIIIAKLIYFT